MSTEFFCLELRSTGDIAGDKYNRMSEILGFDIVNFYKNVSSTRGYLRLNYSIKEPYIRNMKKWSSEYGMTFHVSDAHHKEKGDSGSCCGLPSDERFKFSKCQFTYALWFAKNNGEVKWSDVEPYCVFPDNLNMEAAPGLNTGNTYKRMKKCQVNMKEYMRNTWNDTKDLNSPYRYFSGILIPDRLDENQNIVYKFNYDKAHLVDEFAGNCAGCLQ
jgi:hypothetical protein